MSCWILQETRLHSSAAGTPRRRLARVGGPAIPFLSTRIAGSAPLGVEPVSARAGKLSSAKAVADFSPQPRGARSARAPKNGGTWNDCGRPAALTPEVTGGRFLGDSRSLRSKPPKQTTTGVSIWMCAHGTDMLRTYVNRACRGRHLPLRQRIAVTTCCTSILPCAVQSNMTRQRTSRNVARLLDVKGRASGKGGRPKDL